MNFIAYRSPFGLSTSVRVAIEHFCDDTFQCGGTNSKSVPPKSCLNFMSLIVYSISKQRISLWTPPEDLPPTCRGLIARVDFCRISRWSAPGCAKWQE